MRHFTATSRRAGTQSSTISMATGLAAGVAFWAAVGANCPAIATPARAPAVLPGACRFTPSAIVSPLRGAGTWSVSVGVRRPHSSGGVGRPIPDRGTSDRAPSPYPVDTLLHLPFHLGGPPVDGCRFAYTNPTPGRATGVRRGGIMDNDEQGRAPSTRGACRSPGSGASRVILRPGIPGRSVRCGCIVAGCRRAGNAAPGFRQPLRA